MHGRRVYIIVIILLLDIFLSFVFIPKTFPSYTNEQNVTGWHDFKFKTFTQKDMVITLERISTVTKHEELNQSHVDGHYTGLRLPTVEEIKNLIGKRVIVGLKKGHVVRTSSKRLDLDPHFPPVGDQGSQGSCVSWAVGYYQNGFLQRVLYNWTDNSTRHLMSPAWLYNMVNGGVDYGSAHYYNVEVLKTIGQSTWANMTYDDTNYTRWGNESAWRDAPKHRIKDYYLVYLGNDSGIESIKALLDQGYPVSFGLDAYIFYTAFSDGNYIISSSEYTSTAYNHGQTIVGYDDSITDDGDVGAFRVVNSWGPSWGDHGFYWITYEAMKEKISQAFQYGYVLVPENASYSPKLLATWRFSDPGPRDASIAITIGDPNSTNERKPFLYGGSYNFPNFMALDITEFYQDWKNSSYTSLFYLKIGTDYAGSGPSVVSSFRIEYYPYGYKLLWQNSTESPAVPHTTPGTIQSSVFKPSEYFPYLNVLLKRRIFHRYPDHNATTIIMGNAGNKTDTIYLDLHATNGWIISPEINKATLNPGESIKSTIYIDPPPNARYGNVTLITVRALSENDSSKVFMVEFEAWYVWKPIHIDGDEDFSQQAQQYGWPGDGSINNPYIISNIVIYDEDETGIYINSTTVYAKIENITISDVPEGIWLRFAHNITLINDTLSNIENDGIEFYSSSNITIENCTVNNTGSYGIDEDYDSLNISVLNTTVKTSKFSGLYLSASHAVIRNSTIINGGLEGISIYGSHNLLLNNKVIGASRYGIRINGAHNKIYSTSMENCSIFIDGPAENFISHKIPQNNTVNGRPVYYYKNMTNLKILTNGGEIILGNVSFADIKNMSLSNGSILIEIGHSKNVTVDNITISGATDSGIFVYSSSNISLSSINITNSKGAGVSMEYSSSVYLENSRAYNCSNGIYIYYGYEYHIDNVSIENSEEYGMQIESPSHSIFSNITIEQAKKSGIYAHDGYGYVFDNITVSSSGEYGFEMYYIAYSTIQRVNVLNSTMNGMFLYSISNNRILQSILKNNKWSAIHLRESNFNLLRENNISFNTGFGIALDYDSSSNVIEKNNISNNGDIIQNRISYGVSIEYSCNYNIIRGNTIINNSGYAIYIYSSAGNEIYDNIIIRNRRSNNTFNSTYIQAYDSDGNYWNNSDEGNYWYDWANNNDTNDQNNDGIVDWPYPIDGGNAKDYLPLANKTSQSLFIPSPPYYFTASGGNGVINLSWNAPLSNGGSKIIEYRIYRNGTLIKTVLGNQTQYADYNITPGVTYTYYVTAVNEVGESERSNTAQASAQANVPEFSNALLIILMASFFMWIVYKIRRKSSSEVCKHQHRFSGEPPIL